MEFWISECFVFVVFFCFFVFCLLAVLWLWYTFVVSNVFLRAPKTESDLRCTEKAECTDYQYQY